jgi:hypothetical protein
VWEESIPTDMNLSDQAIVIKPEEKPASKLKSVTTSGKPLAETKADGKRDRSHLRVIK